MTTRPKRCCRSWTLRPAPPIRRSCDASRDARSRRSPRRRSCARCHSERQLQEVLVDFWFNHFNVYAAQGTDGRILCRSTSATSSGRTCFDHFRDLLGATAKSPAMLFYLDNWLSADPNAVASHGGDEGAGGAEAQSATARPARVVRRLPAAAPAEGTERTRTRQEEDARAQRKLRARAARAPHARRRRRLHAEGCHRGRARVHRLDDRSAHGGSSASSRLCTTRARRSSSATRSRRGGGIEDGEQVLDIVASHPSTAHHIAFELAQRSRGRRAAAGARRARRGALPGDQRRSARGRDDDRDLAGICRAGCSGREVQDAVRARRQRGTDDGRDGQRRAGVCPDAAAARRAALHVPAAHRVPRHGGCMGARPAASSHA